MIRAEELTLKCAGCDQAHKEISMVDLGGILVPLVKPSCSRGEDGCIIPHDEKAPVAEQAYSGR